MYSKIKKILKTLYTIFYITFENMSTKGSMS